MIPRHLSLVPVNPFQAAALQAIIDVEDGRRRRGQYPYAVALLRQLRGGEAGRISAADVRRAASNYDPKDRAGEPKERYLAALDKLVESRGSVCPLPLSGCAVGQYFPQTGYRLSERQNRRWDVSYNRREKLQEKARQQKRRRYQTAVAQAEIELAFVTPTALSAWYKRQEKRGNRSRDYLSQEPLLAVKVMSRSALTADLTLPPQSTVVIAQAEKLSLKETLLILEKGQAQGVQMLFIDSENRTGTGNALSVLKDAGVPQYKSYDSQKIPTTVVSEGDKRQRYGRLAQDYAALKSEGQPVVAQASGPREQALLNTAIRTELQATGQLGKDERHLSVIQPVWLDGKNRNQRDSYRVGMVMEQWDRETKTMSRYSIDRVAESTNTLLLVSETGDVRVEKISGLDSSWSTYTSKTMPVAVGEPLMAVGRELEGKIKARDGLMVTGFVDGGIVVSRGNTSLVLDTSRALKLASPLVEGLGASVGDNQSVLVAAGLRDMNGAALNQVARSGNKATLYTSLPQDRAEKRLSSHPNFRVASEQVKGVAGELNLDAAMLKNRDGLRTPVAQSVALGLSRAQSNSIAFSKANLISASLGWSPDVTVSQVDAEVYRQVKNGDLIVLSPVAGAGSGLLVPRVTYEMEKSIIRTVAQGKGAVVPLMERVPDKYLAGLAIECSLATESEAGNLSITRATRALHFLALLGLITYETQFCDTLGCNFPADITFTPAFFDALSISAQSVAAARESRVAWKNKQRAKQGLLRLPLDKLMFAAMKTRRDRFYDYHMKRKQHGHARVRAKRDASRLRAEIEALVKRELTREIAEQRFPASKDAVMAEVARRVKQRMILSRGHHTRLAA